MVEEGREGSGREQDQVPRLGEWKKAGRTGEGKGAEGTGLHQRCGARQMAAGGTSRTPSSSPRGGTGPGRPMGTDAPGRRLSSKEGLCVLVVVAAAGMSA